MFTKTTENIITAMIFFSPPNRIWRTFSVQENNNNKQKINIISFKSNKRWWNVKNLLSTQLKTETFWSNQTKKQIIKHDLTNWLHIFISISLLFYDHSRNEYFSAFTFFIYKHLLYNIIVIMKKKRNTNYGKATLCVILRKTIANLPVNCSIHGQSLMIHV